MTNTKPVTKEEWDRTWKEGLHPWMQQYDLAYWKELFAVKYGKLRPSKPITKEEWDRTFVAGLHPEMKRTDPQYWDSLFSVKFGKTPEYPASKTDLILGTVPRATHTPGADDGKRGPDYVPGYGPKGPEEDQEEVAKLQTEYSFLHNAGQLDNIKKSDPARYLRLARAWNTKPNRFRTDNFVAFDPKIRPAGPKTPRPFQNDGPPGAKYYSGGTPTVSEVPEWSTEVLQREYARLKLSGGLDDLKKSDPKLYLKMLKAWDLPGNGWKPPKGAK